MNTTRQTIAAATEAYLNAQARGDMNEMAAAATRLYEAHSRPLGAGLAWVWLQFETWTTTN